MFLLSDTKIAIFRYSYSLPAAEILGIRSFFRDRSFEQHPRPWKRAREPQIEVPGTSFVLSLEPKIIAFFITGWGYAGRQ